MNGIYNKEDSIELLERLFTMAGIDFRRKLPNEDGGFFYLENGTRKKWEGNIFIKRSLKLETEVLSKGIILVNDLFAEGNECEPDSTGSFEINLTSNECDNALHRDGINGSTSAMFPKTNLNNLDFFDDSIPLFLDAA